jgi:hypothetical protein
MKKIIMTAALAIAAFGVAQAQSSDQSQYSFTVPQVLSIATAPANANFAYNMTEGELLGGKNLPSVTWTVKSNVNWKAVASWEVTGPTGSSLSAASLTNFRNALVFSVGGTPFTLPSSGPASATVVSSAGPTSAAGQSVTIDAHLNAMNYDVMPGTYVATTTVTLSAL